MKIPDLINELFESKEMSEYLIEHSNELSKFNILSMVCKAPIDIRRKAEILSELSKDEDIDKEIAEELNEKDVDISEFEHIKEHIIELSFKFNGEYALKAISHLEAKPGDVFSVQDLWCDEEWPKGYGEGSFHIFSSFENAIKYLEEDMKSEGWFWNDEDALSWYEIRKWSLTEDGDYKEIICYELIDNKLMFFSYSDRDECIRNNFEPNCDLNLITPFSTGDILTVDCMPQKPKRNIIILENVTNCDCCSLQGMFYDPDEKIYSAHAVKHGSIYRGFSIPYISPLYRISKNITELPEEDKIFNDIKSFLNNDSKKGQEMWLWIHNFGAERQKREDNDRKDGVTADETKKYMEEKLNEKDLHIISRN